MTLENPPPNTSGQGKDAVVPPEIRRWNWGAAVFTVLWIYSNGLNFAKIREEEKSFLISSWFVAARGNEIAWKYVRWPSVEAFLHVQRRWEAAALSLLAVICIAFGIQAFAVLSAIANGR